MYGSPRSTFNRKAEERAEVLKSDVSTLGFVSKSFSTTLMILVFTKQMRLRCAQPSRFNTDLINNETVLQLSKDKPKRVTPPYATALAY